MSLTMPFPLLPRAIRYRYQIMIITLFALAAACVALVMQEHIAISDLANIPQGTLLSIALALMLLNPAIFYLLLRARHTERKLQRSEELFSIVLNGINDGVFDYDLTSGQIFYSPSYQKMLGYSENELGSQHDKFYSLIHPEDAPRSGEIFYQYVGRRIPTYHNEFRIRHKAGHYIWVLARGVGIWDDNGNFLRLIGTHTDITSQKEREEELKRLVTQNQQQQVELRNAKERAESANEAKTKFMMTISHELRTPLNAVIGLTEYLQEGHQLSNNQQKAVETINQNSKILHKLINNILDFKNIDSFDYVLNEQLFEPSALMAQITENYRLTVETKKLKLSYNDKTNKTRYIGDAEKIQQILDSLVHNAIKFTKFGGIKISCSSIEDCDSEAGVDSLIFKVCDTGIGIDSSKIDHVFDKFTQLENVLTREYSGAGLSLSYSKALAEALGGSLGVESELNLGSTFTFCVPVRRMKLVDSLYAVTNKQEENSPLSCKKILLVEDYPANVMVAQMMLENLGYNVDVALSGHEAIDKISSQETEYSVILMDVQMPHMDGLETTKLIRQLELTQHKRHHIIGVTAHAMTGDRERCLSNGMDDYISKPINLDILASKLLCVLPLAQKVPA